jgi:hypothetical protein
MNKEILIGLIDPTAVPALQIAGGMFLIINLLAAAWAWRHRRQLFGPDSTATGDQSATRQLQVLVLSIPWLFLTFRLLAAWVETWIG